MRCGELFHAASVRVLSIAPAPPLLPYFLESYPLACPLWPPSTRGSMQIWTNRTMRSIIKKKDSNEPSLPILSPTLNLTVPSWYRYLEMGDLLLPNQLYRVFVNINNECELHIHVGRSVQLHCPARRPAFLRPNSRVSDKRTPLL